MAKKIKLTRAEVQSGRTRVRWAEGLIKQLPEHHEGAQTWLLNYGTGKASKKKRKELKLKWDKSTRSAKTKGNKIMTVGIIRQPFFPLPQFVVELLNLRAATLKRKQEEAEAHNNEVLKDVLKEEIEEIKQKNNNDISPAIPSFFNDVDESIKHSIVSYYNFIHTKDNAKVSDQERKYAAEFYIELLHDYCKYLLPAKELLNAYSTYELVGVLAQSYEGQVQRNKELSPVHINLAL